MKILNSLSHLKFFTGTRAFSPPDGLICIVISTYQFCHTFSMFRLPFKVQTHTPIPEFRLLKLAPVGNLGISDTHRDYSALWFKQSDPPISQRFTFLRATRNFSIKKSPIHDTQTQQIFWFVQRCPRDSDKSIVWCLYWRLSKLRKGITILNRETLLFPAPVAFLL